MQRFYRSFANDAFNITREPARSDNFALFETWIRCLPTIFKVLRKNGTLDVNESKIKWDKEITQDFQSIVAQIEFKKTIANSNMYINVSKFFDKIKELKFTEKKQNTKTLTSKQIIIQINRAIEFKEKNYEVLKWLVQNVTLDKLPTDVLKEIQENADIKIFVPRIFEDLGALNIDENIDDPTDWFYHVCRYSYMEYLISCIKPQGSNKRISLQALKILSSDQ